MMESDFHAHAYFSKDNYKPGCTFVQTRNGLSPGEKLEGVPDGRAQSGEPGFPFTWTLSGSWRELTLAA